MRRRTRLLALVAAAVAAALLSVLLLRSSPVQPARFDATPGNFSWYSGDSQVMFSLRVTNVGGQQSSFRCSFKVFGSTGADLLLGIRALAPDASRVAPQAVAFVPSTHRHDPLATVASHLEPVCIPTPPYHPTPSTSP